MLTTRSEVKETSIMSDNSRGNPVLLESDTVSCRIVVWTMSASTTSWWFVVPIGPLFWFLLPYFVSDKLRKWWIYHAPGKWCMPLSTNKKVKAMRLGHSNLWNCQVFHVIRIICNISCWPGQTIWMPFVSFKRINIWPPFCEMMYWCMLGNENTKPE